MSGTNNNENPAASIDSICTPKRFAGALPPTRFNMARYCISGSAERKPEKPALLVLDDPTCSEPREIWSYRALEDAVLRVAAALQAEGLPPGARIMIRLDNTTDYALLFFGAIAAGLVPIATSSQLSAREAAFILGDSGAEAIALNPDVPMGDVPAGVRLLEADKISHFPHWDKATNYADTAADDPAFLIYTSGTTAEPKGVLHAQRSAWGRRPMYDGWYGITDSDRMLHAGAFNWTYTLGTGLTDPWAVGATAIVYTGPRHPSIWPELIAKHGATIFAAVPGVYRQILKYGSITREHFHRFRHGLTAGETLPASLLEEWTDRTGKMLYEALGMSELSTYISSSPSVPPRRGAIGCPQPGRAVAILNDDGLPLPPGEAGLLAVHRTDPGLMLGYWNRPREEKEVFKGQWFCGGDLAHMDEDRYVYHDGRSNDLMNALGYRVSPLEIEQVFSLHPGVADVAVAEIQVARDLYLIAAFVVPTSGYVVEKETLKIFASQSLATYKVPKKIIFVDDLPRTANGKVRRAELRTRHWNS